VTPAHAAIVDGMRETGRNVALMVVSLDGAIAINGSVGELTGPADQQLMVALRERAAVVVVGARTVETQGYGELLNEAARRRRREAGLPAQPQLAIVCRDPARLADTEPLRAEDLSVALLCTAGERPPATARAALDLLPTNTEDEPDLHRAVELLRQRRGEGLILWEGGPTILTMAVRQGVLDELVLVISPRLVGGGARHLLVGEALIDTRVSLLAHATAEGFVFLRYGLRRAAEAGSATDHARG
jgi:riboflavin biosynthesis pyrimidine reductase